MAEPHVVSALVRKRAELAGEIETLEGQVTQRRADLLHIDAVLRLYGSNMAPDEIRPKRKNHRRNWFAQGELVRLVLEALRRASEPMTSKEVALAIMDAKGFDASDDRTVRLVDKRVFSVLTRRQGNFVEKVDYGARNVGWRVR